MTDISHYAALVVEAVQNAAYDITEATKKRDEGPPTPFQRAVIGGLVLIAQAMQQQAGTAADATGSTLGPMSWIDAGDAAAARNAVGRFLVDETPRPA